MKVVDVTRLRDRVALVTGAASAAGLGFATARRLAREGARVMLTDIDGDQVATRADELLREGLDVSARRQDVTDEGEWRALVGGFGDGLDILVNNAGIAVLKTMGAMTMADWRRQIDVNLTSVYLGCQAAMAHMHTHGRGGAIVNLSSVAGLIGIPGASAYSASKGGVRSMSKSLAMEGAPAGIRVNSVHPGVILTDMQQVAIRDNPAQYDAINASIPLGRMGEPDDIAAAIAFLASDDARYVTGAEFVIDGGMTAR